MAVIILRLVLLEPSGTIENLKLVVIDDLDLLSPVSLALARILRKETARSP